MKYIDLALIDYGDGNREVCIAPKFKMEVCQKVMTAFGIGKVVEVATIHDDDEVLKLFCQVVSVRRVTSIIKDLEYKEDEHDLPEE